LPWRDVRALVCGKRVLFPVLPLLTKAVAPLYFWRRMRVSPLQALGASELVSMCERTAVRFLVTLTLLVSDVRLGADFTALLAVWWLVALLVLAWLWSPALRRFLPKLRSAALLHAFTRMTPSELAVQLGIRGAHQVLTLACLWGLLAGHGARLSAPQLFAFG